jgi:hypothetical protein
VSALKLISTNDWPKFPTYRASSSLIPFLKLYEQRNTCSEQRQYLRTSLLFLGSLPCLYPMFETHIELAIDQHYRVVQQMGEYYVMDRVI